MEYRSAVFDGVRRIMKLAADKDGRPIAWMYGLVGANGGRGLDPIEGRTEFSRFVDTTLRSGPVRAADVELVNRMIASQQGGGTGLAFYDSATGTEWHWDGNPVTHVAASALGREAAKRLGDGTLVTRCVAVEHRALETIATRFEATLPELARRAREQAGTLARRHDVKAALAALDASVTARGDAPAPGVT